MKLSVASPVFIVIGPPIARSVVSVSRLVAPAGEPEVTFAAPLHRTKGAAPTSNRAGYTPRIKRPRGSASSRSNE